MEVIPIDLSKIDFEDKTFYLGNKSVSDSLIKTIRDIGLINPPVLRQKGLTYQIVTGWKRLISSKEIGSGEVSSKVYKSGEITDSDCLKLIYLDNKSRISDLELSALIVLYKQLCAIDNEEIICELLPFLDIPASRKHLDKYLALASLDDVIKDAFYDDQITIEQCQMLSEISKENHVPIFKCVLLKYKLNNNESRQVMQLIEEIALRDLEPVTKIVDKAESTIDSNNLNKNSFRSALRKLRYPDLNRVEERFKEAVDDLKLPNNVRLHVDQYFEGNDLEFRIKIKNSEELENVLNKLQEESKSGGINKLLSLLIKGN